MFARPGQAALLEDLYKSALGAANPMRVLLPHLPCIPAGRTIIVGVGKAAAAMAKAVEANWNGPLEGIVVVPRGATLHLQKIRQIESAHPVPDEISVAAGALLMQAVTGLTADDMVIALISGGGSSLCALPAEGVTLLEKQSITKALLRRGATIREMNAVRKHLSSIKGGRLAIRAYPARVVSLLISDIPGDDVALIASAPTLADPTTCLDALRVLQHYEVEISHALQDSLASLGFESPKPDDPRFTGHSHVIIASAQDGLNAAAEAARTVGWNTHILSDAMEGNARDLALAHVAIARQIQRHGQPFKAPCILLSGGEATVTVKGNGRGGRNTEFALAMAMALQGQAGIYALSAGTDGLDGSGDAAGAWIAPGMLEHAQCNGLNSSRSIEENDTFSFFDAIGATVVTGPTYTNINDFRAVLIEPVHTSKI